MIDGSAAAGLVDNETRRFVADALASGNRDIRLDCNPSFQNLAAVLRDGRPGDLSVAFRVGEEVTQGNGVVGGGTLANMLDSAIAVAVLSALRTGQTCSTVSLTVNMMRAAMHGDFVAHAEVEKLGRRIAFANAQLCDAGGRLVATATSSLAIMELG